MKEYGMPFSDRLVLKILADLKWETRRVPIRQPRWEETPGLSADGNWCGRYRTVSHGSEPGVSVEVDELPNRGALPGDVAYVREAWHCPRQINGSYQREKILHRATFEGINPPRWVPPFLMPRQFARLFLDVLEVRFERLQDITEEGARAEGVTDGGCLSCGNPEPCGCEDPRPDARDAFANLWGSVHSSPRARSKGGKIVKYVAFPWGATHPINLETEYRGKPLEVYPNPWVRVVRFKRRERV